MNEHRTARSLGLGLGLFLATLMLIFLAAPAWARSGRSAVAPAPRASDGGQAAAAQPAAPVTPTAPVVPSPTQRDPHNGTPGGTALPSPTDNGARRGARPALNGRRTSVPTLGIVDWVYWYEANRERFEDLRAIHLLTDENPVFAVGKARGVDVGRATVRVGDRARMRILDTLARVLEPGSTHWLHTEAAAYVALGKVAVTAAQVESHFDALAGPKAQSDYLQESAVLGLGHLARADARHRLPAALLDRARDVLLDVLRNPQYGTRTRALAGVSLGLLADQPSARGKDAAVWTGDKLFRTWIGRDLPDEVQVGTLLGLSRVEPAAVPQVVRLVLEGCALRGRKWPTPASATVRAHALLTLAHLGDATNVAAISEVLRQRRGVNPVLRQAAALAAAVLGQRDAAARGPLGADLLEALDKTSEPGTRHLVFIALGRLLAADVASENTALLEKGGVGKVLLEALRRGPPAERAFAALASALAVRGVDHTVDSGSWQMFRFDVLEALDEGLGATDIDAHTRGAYGVGLGLALDRLRGGTLLAILVDEGNNAELRACAALGLGLMGDMRPGAIDALTRALADPRSELLRMRAATALGLLGGRDFEDRERIVKTLVEAVNSTRSQAFKGQVAVTLGRLGDARALAPLTAVLEGDREAHLNRAVACSALGLIGSEEIHPLLLETRENAHYMSGADVVSEILDLL